MVHTNQFMIGLPNALFAFPILHPIQIKSGRLNENGKSVQWHTAKTPKANEPSRLY